MNNKEQTEQPLTVNPALLQAVVNGSSCVDRHYKCLLCGRDKFTAKQPHKCRGGFRKRKIKWAKV